MAKPNIILDAKGRRLCGQCRTPLGRSGHSTEVCQVWARDPRPRRGASLPWQMPMRLHAETDTVHWHPQFERYLLFWADTYPKALADLELHFPQHYKVHIALYHGTATVAELAVQCAVSPWTIYSWKRRALLFLRRQLDPTGLLEGSPTDALPE